MTINLVISLIIVVLLLFASALISGSEVAYFSLSATDKHKLKKKNKTNTRVIRNLENPVKLLATILTTNNFVNIGIIILTANITDRLITIVNAPVIEFIFKVVLIS